MSQPFPAEGKGLHVLFGFLSLVSWNLLYSNFFSSLLQTDTGIFNPEVQDIWYIKVHLSVSKFALLLGNEKWAVTHYTIPSSGQGN